MPVRYTAIIVPRGGGAPVWPLDIPPSIITHPAGQTSMIGETATFSVKATGTAPLYYQWQKNGVNIEGAYSSSYTTPATTLSDKGTTFRCIITNDFGTVTSDHVELMVDTTLSDTTPPIITLWYGTSQRFGQRGNPQQWVNILGNTSDLSGIASLNYSLNNGISQPLSIGPDGRRLQSNGDFNIEIDYAELNCSDNQLIINAADSFGNVKSETVTVNYSCYNIWPKSYSINWSSVTNIQDSVQVVDGLWTKEPNSIRPSIIGYDRLVAMGDNTWEDYEVTVPITINEQFDSSLPWGPNVGIIMRWQGHYDRDGTQPRYGWWPLGALGVYIWDSQLKDYRLKIIGNDMKVIANDMSEKHLEVGVTYMFKMRAQTINGNTYYSLKVWEQGSPEPLDWTVSGIGVGGELKQGSLLLASHYVNASFGDVTIIPGPFNPAEPENTPPTVIGNTPTGTDVPVTTVMTVTFNESMNTTSVDSAFSTNPSVAGTKTWSGDTMTFTPSADLTPSTLYEVTIATGAEDLAGNPLATVYLWNFTTAAESDNTPPTVIGNTPTGTDVPVTTVITVTFNESMNTTSAENAFSTSPSVNGIFGWSGDTMTFTPSADLTPSTLYEVTIATGAEDLAGNPLATVYLWNFTTAAESDNTPPTVIGNTPTGTDVPVTTVITVTFNESMNTTSAENAFSTSP
ncbi:MAG: Ig-like domain-containing protein, partial [ANME-2 cluster archaeon]|nr:Ig-like domain-containing protein [ANME-2 cluster archaeon]